MRFDREELAKIIVGMYHDVCDNYTDCAECPLYTNCSYYTAINVELENSTFDEE